MQRSPSYESRSMRAAVEDRPVTASGLSLVLIEDNPADARLIEEMVLGERRDGFELTCLGRLSEARSHLSSNGAACVLLDLSLPDAVGLEGVDALRSEFAQIPIVIITGHDDEDTALKALHAGAQDYLIKGQIRGDAVRRAVRYAVERKRGEEEVARLGRQNELILNSAAEGICGLDASGTISFANPAAASMLGWSVDDLIGMAMHDVAHGADPSEAGHSDGDCPVHLSLSEGEPRTINDDAFRRRNGTTFPVECASTPIVDRGQLLGAVVTFSDITERKRFETQLQYLADHDALTGLYNRHRFEEELTRQLAHSAHYGGGGALLILDLDNFKYVNDAFGHHAGDELIRSIAGLVSRRLRSADVVARLGGDEFGILLGGVDASEARSVATSLVDLVRGHASTVGEQALRITASIGATLLDRPELTAEQLLVEADVAMYEAKDAGRDAVHVHRPGASPKAPRQTGLAWTDRIKTALEEDLFVVQCQPIVHLADGPGARYELLIRMASEDDDLIPPGAFLPAAERFGLVRDIDVWMVRQAVDLIDAERTAGRSLVLEVNVSARSIREQEFPMTIERALEEASIDPASLVLEITETAAIANMEQARRFASRIREMGCEFALDDFGAGFGSFYYLKHLSVDYLKIDGEFVRGLARSQIDQRMVKSMVEIARGLDLRTIAESVETAESLRLLREYGVDFAQGYHLGRPGPVDEIGAPQRAPEEVSAPEV
jgi:diguanylate cyclase (GGDEF)-like protein/PAS domain S-box-containing protein